MKPTRLLFILTAIILLTLAGCWTFKKFNFNFSKTVGQPIDSLNGVIVYFNGGVDHVSDRSLGSDNYNIGLKYQCVEFVKRYYFEYLKHKMPDAYGHAKDFFDNNVLDGNKNTKRDLIQYTNPSISKPQVNDLIIFKGTFFNKYGHVAIISKVSDSEIEIIQQNPGPFGNSRAIFDIKQNNNKWEIADKVLGWLRKE